MIGADFCQFRQNLGVFWKTVFVQLGINKPAICDDLEFAAGRFDEFGIDSEFRLDGSRQTGGLG